MDVSNSHFSINYNTRPGGFSQSGHSAEGERPDDVTGLLSIAHIPPFLELPLEYTNPFIEFVPGASYFKVSKGGYSLPRLGGGKRSTINGFSYSSRKRLMSMMARIPSNAPLPYFVTLTYPDRFPTPLESKRHLEMFKKRLLRQFPNAGFIWKLEPQDRGAPHYHLLLWGPELDKLREWVPFNWYKVAGDGDSLHLRWHLGLLGKGNKNCVQSVKSYKGVLAYASKYLGKAFTVAGWNHTGRFWAVVKPNNIPFGELYKFDVEYSKAIESMRYQRSFLRSKERLAADRAKKQIHQDGQLVPCGVENQKPTNKKKNKFKYMGRSLLTYCDASTWVKNIMKE